MKLFRAESGYTLRFAFAPPAERDFYAASLWRTTNHRHYLPLAYWGDLQFARFAQLRPAIWRGRQMLTLTWVACVTFLFFRTLGRQTGMAPPIAAALATGATAVLAFQPLMNELVGWPVLFFHLNWIGFTFLSGYALLRTVSDAPRALWVWIAAGASYFTMHCYGIGFAVALTMVAALGGLCAALRGGRLENLRPFARHLNYATLLTASLTFLHLLAMCLLPVANVATEAGQSFFGLGQLLGLIALFPSAVGMALIGIAPFPYVNRESFADPGMFGLLLCLGATAAIWYHGKRWWREDSWANRSQLAAIFFCFSISILSLLMMGARMATEPARLGSYGFLIGPRYLVPVSFPIVGGLFALVVNYFRASTSRALIGAFLLFLGTIANHLAYNRNVYQRSAQLRGAPQIESWRATVAAVQDARAANRPIPNLSTDYLMEDMAGFHLKFFEPVLRHDLHLQPGDELSFADNVPLADYAASSPRWKELEEIIAKYTPPPPKY